MPTSRHTQLYTRYQERLKQFRNGTLLLGVKGMAEGEKSPAASN
jgi:hypothetical protein